MPKPRKRTNSGHRVRSAESKARRFYRDVLGLQVVLNQGWIATFAAQFTAEDFRAHKLKALKLLEDAEKDRAVLSDADAGDISNIKAKLDPLEKSP